MKPQVTMVGNLTADTVHVFQNDDGTARRCLFTVACNSEYKNKNLNPNDKDYKVKSVDFIPCIAWGGLVDILIEWGLKGRKVHIAGTLEAYQAPADEDGTYPPPRIQVRAEKVEFCALEDSAKAKLEAKKAGVADAVQAPVLSQADILAALAKLLTPAA